MERAKSQKSTRVKSQGKPPGGNGIFDRKNKRRMERKQKKAIKADYFSRRHVAIKKQVEKQKKFERERKEKQKKKQMNMNKNKNKNKSKDKQTFKKEIKAKSQQKKRDIKSLQKQKEAETNAKESIQVSDDEEIKSDEIIDSDSSEDVVAQKPEHKTSQKKQKKGFQMLEANTIPKESELESDIEISNN